jgi:hypothetical protein
MHVRAGGQAGGALQAKEKNDGDAGPLRVPNGDK